MNSRPYYQQEPIIIPLETNEVLQDPRPQPKDTLPEPSLSEEIDHLLSQEHEISASLHFTDAKEEDIWRLIDSI